MDGGVQRRRARDHHHDHGPLPSRAALRGPEALRALAPALFSCALSFLFIGIYWTHHHHMLQATTHVDGRVLWANLHLLFWLTRVPFATAWMGENRCAPWPVAPYGVVLLLAAIAYFVLARALITLHGKDSVLAMALGRDVKGKARVLVYLAAIPLAFERAWIAVAPYLLVALMWLAPDRRIEKVLPK